MLVRLTAAGVDPAAGTLCRALLGREEGKAFESKGAWFLVPASAAAVKERLPKTQPLPEGEPTRDESVLDALAADSIVPPEHREALMRDLVHAPVKREAVIQGTTHVAQFDPRREELFRAVEAFLSERMQPEQAR